jgi:hypothetical protein
MGRVGGILCVVCLLASTASAQENFPHVRGTNGYARWLIETAIAYSVTVSALANNLSKTDVVAYVRIAPIGSGTAKTVLLNTAGPIRYLLLTIDSGHQPDGLVEMLAHELQHATEIAAAPEVRDEATLVSLYRRIGLHRAAKTNFETVLAQEMGRRARFDLANRPAALYARGSQ